MSNNDRPKWLFGVNPIGGGNTPRSIIATAHSVVFSLVLWYYYDSNMSICKCKRIVKCIDSDTPGYLRIR